MVWFDETANPRYYIAKCDAGYFLIEIGKINSYAQMCFVVKMSEEEAVENAKNVIKDQYFQSIMNTESHHIP